MNRVSFLNRGYAFKGLLAVIHVPDSSLYIICVFYSSRIRTLVAMVTLSFHTLIMRKVETIKDLLL